MTVYTVCVKAKASLGNDAYTTECSFNYTRQLALKVFKGI